MKTLTLLLLLLGLCGLSMQGCDRKLYRSQRMFGKEQIGITKRVYGVRECQRACTNNERCTFFNFFSFTRCRLFSDGSQQMRPARAQDYTGFSLRYCDVMDCKMMKGINMEGPFYKEVQDVYSALACSLLCYYELNCKFFVYSLNDYSRRYRKHGCYLKEGVPVRKTTFFKVISGDSARYCK